MELTRNLGRRVLASRVQGGKEYLSRVSEQLKEDGIFVELAVREGAPPDRIVQYALENTVDLIIMSSRGTGGFRRLVSGSTTDRVIRASHLPVLVVPLV